MSAGITRINEKLAECKAAGKTAFVPFVPAGYPTHDDTVPILLAMQEGGADIIEVGVPFSDPLADGATIEAANMVALKGGVTLAIAMQYVKDARAAGLTVPVILMGYYNPFLAYGEKELMLNCVDVGVDGFIVVDLPCEAAIDFRELAFASNLAWIPLVAPVTSDERMAMLAKISSGYIYCVALTGVTGARSALPDDLPQYLARCRKAFSQPLAVGFGLSSRQHLLDVGKLADAAVMGSQVVKVITAGGDTPTERAASVKAFFEEITGIAPAAKKAKT